MEKEMIEEKNWQEIIGVCLTIVLIVVFFVFSYLAFFNEDRQCLKQMAEEYCITQNLTYSSMSIIPAFFFCYDGIDKHNIKEFYFIEEERQGCRRIG